jgi:hypothetical protein
VVREEEGENKAAKWEWKSDGSERRRLKEVEGAEEKG